MVKVARGFFCPECGWNVGRDEDGLCLTCGVTTTDNPVVLAAPDMLGALELIVMGLTDESSDTEDFGAQVAGIALAAVAKARSK